MGLIKGGMTKVLALVIILMMAIQVIKPLGFPGLRRRRDSWKLAVFALAAISLTAMLNHFS
jgi:hypothetical protein